MGIDVASIYLTPRRAALTLLCLLLPWHFACLFPETINPPLLSAQPQKGYRFANIVPGPGNTDETFVCLTLSGGGTRAAALAYGVMQGLKETEWAPRSATETTPLTLLDEVDVISSVSGGSFAAMGYGIWRERFFDGVFHQQFLDLNLHTVLLQALLNPINAIRLPSALLDRIDVVAKYYDEEVFDKYTFDHLIERGTRPFIVINATNLAISDRFQFTQSDFDLLASDLGRVPVGFAVAASSAFPVLFSPLRLRYHEPPADLDVIHRLVTMTDENHTDHRLARWAHHIATEAPVAGREQFTLDDDHHRFLFLADGGLVDNLGLSYVIESHQRGDIRRLIDAGRIKRFIVIAVDAGVERPFEIERHALSPGVFMQAYQAATIGVNNYSQTLVRVMDYLMTEEPRLHAEAAAALRRACPDAAEDYAAGRALVERHFLHIGFHLIKDPDERRRFERIDTSLYLPRAQVDALVTLGRTLVKQEIARRDFGNEPAMP